MKNMDTAKEYFQAPPPGRYPSKIVAAEATFAKKSGASMLRLTLEVRGPAEHAGAQADDYIITDGGAKGAGMGKIKLRGLGFDVSTPGIEIPDEKIASDLLGREIVVEYGNEPRMTESVKGSGNYDTPATAYDEQLGREVVLNKLTVKGYFAHQTAPAQAQRPVQAVAQGAMAPQAPQYAPQQQYPQQQFAPQQFAQPQYPQQGIPPQYAPQMQAPQYQAAPQAPVYEQGNGTPAAVPPWLAQAPQAPAPAETEETAAKRGRGRPKA